MFQELYREFLKACHLRHLFLPILHGEFSVRLHSTYRLHDIPYLFLYLPSKQIHNLLQGEYRLLLCMYPCFLL